ncbi:distal tail protein Dit [Lacticaseibacillus suilingensis]|uniref:Distal tail protein Dit n=1 Tax=Lacticaseibacillus suilingensis TaxID=2799577 RepID=A0ABW4BFM5_9LACO|nr:distal tail protein Dit [Lacticaseibacillus suilingensis]
MTFNGHQIGDRFLQFAPDRGILSEVENTMQTVGTSDGDRFMRGRIKSRVLAVQYDVMAISQREFERMMAPLLYTTEPAKLSFSDRADEYWLAKVDGKIDLTRAYFLGSGTINFIVPDGVAYSLTTKTTSNVGSDGALSDEIIVQNDGTYPVYPVIEATMHSDNGVLTLINESNGGVIQLGNKSEIDGYNSKRPERVLNIGFDSDPGGTANATGTNYPNYNGVSGQANKQVGSMQFVKDSLGGSAMQPVFSNSGVNYWGGPSRVFKVPVNSAGSNTGNINSLIRFQFDTNAKAMGRLELAFLNGATVVMGVVIRDSMIAGDQMVIECWVGNQKVKEYSLNRKTFKNGQYYQLKMYRFSARLGFEIAPVASIGTGNTAVLRTSVVFPFQITNHEPVDGFGVWFERWQQTQHCIMGVSDLQFSWTDVEYWTDTENLYEDGDVLDIDTAQRQILLNGVLTNDLDRYGNDWDMFKLAPGTNKLNVLCSDFATTPTVQAEIREAYL